MKTRHFLILLGTTLVLFLTALTAQKSGEQPAPPCLEIPPPDLGERGAADDRLLWPKRPGARLTLDVYFFNGSEALRDQVLKFASEWSPHCQVFFRRVNSPNAPIRINIGPGGHWSMVGIEARRVKPGKPTMNLELTDDSPEWNIRRVALHEFGHALGLKHEHQSPNRPFEWNREAVMAYY